MHVVRGLSYDLKIQGYLHAILGCIKKKDKKEVLSVEAREIRISQVALLLITSSV